MIHPIKQTEAGASIEAITFKAPKLLITDEISKQCCRICLCDQTENTDQFITPCKCSGSLKYVHMNCCSKWARHIYESLQTQDQKDEMECDGFECEVCKFKIQVIFEFQRHLVTKSELKEICQDNIPLTVTIVVFFMIALGTFSFLIQQADSTKSQFDGSQPSRAFFTILAILIIVVFFGAGLFFFISRYIWIESIKIVDVKNYQNSLQDLQMVRKKSKGASYISKV